MKLTNGNSMKIQGKLCDDKSIDNRYTVGITVHLDCSQYKKIFIVFAMWLVFDHSHLSLKLFSLLIVYLLENKKRQKKKRFFKGEKNNIFFLISASVIYFIN